MLRELRRRLDRLWVVYQREKAYCESVSNRHAVREKFAAAVRAGLTRAGIDPATVPAMRRYDDPDDFFAQQANPPPPPETPADRLRAKLLRILDHHRDHPLDLATATPMELFALYCFVPDAPGVAYISHETGEIVGASVS